MTTPRYAVLIADADPTVRRELSTQLAALGVTVFEAADGGSALRTVQENDIRVVLCELYLVAGGDADLIAAIRRNPALSGTRTVVHTRFAKSADSVWARSVGADAFLIRPVSGDRLRAVVTSIAGTQHPGATAATTTAATSRDISLDTALTRIENGSASGVSGIVVGRAWWTQLTRAEQSPYRKRAKKAGITLSMNRRLRTREVEVHSAGAARRSATETESPYLS